MRSANREKIRLMSENSSVPADAPQRCLDASQSSVRTFTRAELELHDGTDPARSVLIGYKGKIYDVTASYPWAKGSHWGDVRAGQDLTGRLKESIHGEEMLLRVLCVGLLLD